MFLNSKSKLAVLILGFLGIAAFASAGDQSGAPKKQTPAESAATQHRLDDAANKFLENAGQWNAKALYMARAKNMNVWLERDGMTLDYYRVDDRAKRFGRQGQAIHMSFEGMKNPSFTAVHQSRMITDFIRTNTARHTAKGYDEVLSEGIYPGIEARNYFQDGRPRYDLIVAAGANPAGIKLRFQGADSVKARGANLVLGTHLGPVQQQGLVAYQVNNGARIKVSATFRQIGLTEVAFNLGAYDHTRQLIIDPLVYGTYYGGDNGMDEVRAVVTDKNGGTYLTGYTMAPDFPSIYGPYGFNLAGPYGAKDAFISKLQGDAYNHDYAAYIGGSLNDYGQFLQVDPFGNIWMAGRTESSDFPGNTRPNIQYIRMTRGQPTNGTFEVTYGGANTTVPLPFNVTALEMQNALQAALGTANITVDDLNAPATLEQGAVYRVTLPNNLPLLLEVTNSTMEARYVALPYRNDPAFQIQTVVTNPVSTPGGGTYTLTPQGRYTDTNGASQPFPATAPIAYNAAPAAIGAALNAAFRVPLNPAFPAVTTQLATVRVIGEGTNNTTALPGNPTLIYYIGTKADAAGNTFFRVPISVDTTLVTGGAYEVVQVPRESITWDPTSSLPTGGTFTALVNGVPTVALPWNTPAFPIQAAIAALANVGGVGNVFVNTPNDAPPSQLPAGIVGGNFTPATMIVSWIGALVNAPPNLFIDNSRLLPRPVYSFDLKATNVFVMRFTQSNSSITGPLTPFPTATLMFGGEQSDMLAGFSIVPNDNPSPGDPIRIAFAGTQKYAIAGVPGNNPDLPAGDFDGFVARYDYNTATNTYSQVGSLTHWVTGGNGVDVSGVTTDRFGSVYVAGTVHYQGKVDTAQNPVFVTTPGVYFGGRLLRDDDIFAQKYLADGTLSYSTLIGGDGFDHAGGLDIDATGAQYNTGSCIAVDQNLNAYVTGVAASFNYPRTRNTFGQIFSAARVVVVTKLSPDASALIYSTNLQTSGWVEPCGIAVDVNGDAFITGTLHPNVIDFPDTPTGNDMLAGNGNEPNSQPLSSIITYPPLPASTAPPYVDPVPQRAYLIPPAPQLATTKGFVNVLTPAADNLIFGSYIGGQLDQVTYGPYLDGFGDLWICGSIDNYRDYGVLNSSLLSTDRLTDLGGSPLPEPDYTSTTLRHEGWINQLAFKQSADANGKTFLSNLDWGNRNSNSPNYVAFDWPKATTPIPGTPKPKFGAVFKRDGFVARFRVGTPTTASVILNPTTAPGGLGQTVTATVNLTTPAPVGGAAVQLTLSGVGASFSPNGTQTNTQTLNIAAGATSATTTIYTEAVQANSNVQLKASFQGSIAIGQFTVTPWLQSLTLSPTRIVGGNQVTARITLAAPAPTGGAPVQLTTDSPSLISFPGGSTVNIPAGQSSAVVNIDTNGVNSTTATVVTASLLGLGSNQTLTLTPVNLVSVSFSPAEVAGGSIAIGTISLDGKVGTAFTATVSINPGTPGYVITPQTVTFNPGDTQETFQVQTVYEPASTSRVITVTRPTQGSYNAETVTGTLLIDNLNLTGFTISPTTVKGGQQSTGTVTIGGPAPAGGVVVTLSTSVADAPYVTIPSTVTVPVGATMAQFPITANVTALDKTVTITASRGAVSLSATLNIQGVTFALSVSPTSVVGGNANAIGTITLSNPAPAGGATVSLSSNDSHAVVPATVTVPQNAKSVNFGITTNSTANTITATITGTLGSNTSSAQLEVRAIGVASVTFVPVSVRGGSTVKIVVTLDAPVAPGQILLVTLSASNPTVFSILPASVSIGGNGPNRTTGTVTAVTRRVTRTLTTAVSATYGASTASGVLTITR